MFKVDIREIVSINKHPNADRLNLVKVNGTEYQFIKSIDSTCAVGDKVVYFPIDSLIPEELAEKMEVTNYLSKGRVKTIKLRGEFSQGIITPIGLFTSLGLFNSDLTLGTDVTEILGVTKYEPEPVVTTGGVLYPLPNEVEKYDIENCENEKIDWEKEKSNGHVSITEKLEGTNFSIIFYKNGDIKVCSHRREVEKNEENLYWEAARDLLTIDPFSFFSAEHITIRGEIIGPKIQGNYYDLKERKLYIFDIQVDGQYVDYISMLAFCEAYKLTPVPLIFMGKYCEYVEDKTIASKSDGKSKINVNKLREGIVIKDVSGRPILKQRSPEYLAKEK